jgi:hypothetical protein
MSGGANCVVCGIEHLSKTVEPLRDGLQGRIWHVRQEARDHQVKLVVPTPFSSSRREETFLEPILVRAVRRLQSWSP